MHWSLRFELRPVGHAGLYLADDVALSANPTYGIRFCDRTSDFRDDAAASGEALVTRIYK